MSHTFTVEISDLDYEALCHDLLDPEDWVQKAVEGKIHKCRERMEQEAIRLFKADPGMATIPANQNGILEAALKHAGYKNRTKREELAGTPHADA